MKGQAQLRRHGQHGQGEWQLLQGRLFLGSKGCRQGQNIGCIGCKGCKVAYCKGCMRCKHCIEGMHGIRLNSGYEGVKRGISHNSC